MKNNNQNNYVPEHIKKPTATVSYFNEAEWNKDLSKEDLKQQEALEAGYLIEQEDQLPSYGPCNTCGVSDKKFELDLNLRNAVGGHLTGSAYNTSQARSESTDILSGNGDWSGGISKGGCYRRKNRETLVSKINDAINEHTSDGGKTVIRTLWAG